MPQAIPAVWVYTAGAQYNQGAAPVPAFLTAAQMARMERIRQARMIYDGRHREYFLDERRSQFDFPTSRVGSRWGDRDHQPYVKYNLTQLACLKSADLLFGDAPMFHVTVPAQEEALKALIDRSGLHTFFHGCATDCSYEGESFIEASIQDGQVFLSQVPADEIFPNGVMQPDRQFKAYDRLAVKNAGSESSPIWLLLVQTYAAGSISRRVWQLDEKGDKKGEVGIENWPIEEGEQPIEALTRTGLDVNTITYVPNLLLRGQPISDVDQAIELQDELNAKQTQIARVLERHSDPKIAMPADAADNRGYARSDYNVHFFRTKEDIPQYITWNGELKAALDDRDFVENSLLIVMEMSPVLLGIKKSTGGKAESFKAIRLQAYNSITKARRKSMFWKDGVRRALTCAQLLENTQLGIRYDMAPIGVDLNDGIPVDDLDQANRQAILRSSGLMSIHRALQEQLADPNLVEAEEQELEKENEAKQPSIIIGAPGMNLPGVPASGTQPVTEPEEEQASSAAESDVEDVAA